MREKLHRTPPLVPSYIDHPEARELRVIGERLDSMPELLDSVHADLVAGLKAPGSGRRGLTAEQVLRALLLKQRGGFTYEELSFHLADSRSFRAFCRFGIADTTPSASALQRNISKLRPETLEALNRAVVRQAVNEGLAAPSRVRGDCTVTLTNIHAPTDSSLLFDCIRVLVRLLLRARSFLRVGFTNHLRRAKRREVGIRNARRKAHRVPLYRDLLKVVGNTLRAAVRTADRLEALDDADARTALRAFDLSTVLRRFIDATERVMDQTRRRVLQGETVPARDKVVSIFEPHTDIIRKDHRETLYGHKLFVMTTASGLVTDCVVLDGNPADSTLTIEMVRRQAELLGDMPAQVAFDGGFASRANLEALKNMGVRDVSFSKGRGLDVSEMVSSPRVYRLLRNFRAGVESVISFLKRAFGLDRCAWRGPTAFKSYVWSSILSANLTVLARQTLG